MYLLARRHTTTYRAPRGAFFEGFHRQGAGSTIKPRRGLSGRWGCPTQFLTEEVMVEAKRWLLSMEWNLVPLIGDYISPTTY